MEIVLLLAAFFVASSLFGGLLAMILIATDDTSRDVGALEFRRIKEELRRTLIKERELAESLDIKTKELAAVRQISEHERARYDEVSISLRTQLSYLQNQIDKEELLKNSFESPKLVS